MRVGKWYIVPDGPGTIKWRPAERWVEVEVSNHGRGSGVDSLGMLPKPPEIHSFKVSYKTLGQMLLSREELRV